MTDNDPLARSYARLLRSYPGWHRREHGLEILTTLLDAAEPGSVGRPCGMRPISF
jgi:hypothetical protein